MPDTARNSVIFHLKKYPGGEKGLTTAFKRVGKGGSRRSKPTDSHVRARKRDSQKTPRWNAKGTEDQIGAETENAARKNWDDMKGATVYRIYGTTPVHPW